MFLTEVITYVCFPEVNTELRLSYALLQAFLRAEWWTPQFWLAKGCAEDVPELKQSGAQAKSSVSVRYDYFCLLCVAAAKRCDCEQVIKMCLYKHTCVFMQSTHFHTQAPAPLLAFQRARLASEVVGSATGSQHLGEWRSFNA